MVGGHGAGYSRGEDVGGADWEAEAVGGSDGGHGGDFGDCALGVGEVALANFFSHGDDDAFPSDHGAEAEGHGYGDFYPERNEARGVVDVLFVVGEDGGVLGGDLGLAAFLHEAQGFADQVHVVAEVAHAVVGDVLHLFVQSGFVADVVDHGAQR